MKPLEVLTPPKQIMNEGRESHACGNKSIAPGESALGVNTIDVNTKLLE